MPFDIATETPAIRRARLIEALRNDTEWKWNFCNTAGCAIGMARHLGLAGSNSNLCDNLGLSDQQFGDIFGCLRSVSEFHLNRGWSPYYGMPRAEVTPGMVADALEKIG